MQHIAILGRQPDISFAELASLFPDKVERLGTDSALVTDVEIDLNRLGGTIKLCEYLITLEAADWEAVLPKLVQICSETLNPNSKSVLGLSLHGASLTGAELFRSALTLKKELKKLGFSIRIAPSKGLSLNAAEITHNNVIRSGADMVVVRTKNKIYLGRTVQVQDIDAYSNRDYGRPARSAKVGMLPPKLAQIMINLANPPSGSTILDPFCGTGVVLQEALLMGHPVIGSDIAPGMVEMTQQNLSWLQEQLGRNLPFRLETGDATSFSWPKPIGAVASEGYLGPALTKTPSQDEVKSMQTEISSLLMAFFKNLAPQIPAGTPVCLTIPAWKVGGKFAKLVIIDQILDLGYTTTEFTPTTNADLVYSRPDQIVGRQLIILRRK